MSNKSKPSEELSLVQRRAKLEEILTQLEAGDVPIEKVAGTLTEAAELAESIEHDLRKHKASIQVLKKRFDTKE